MNVQPVTLCFQRSPRQAICISAGTKMATKLLLLLTVLLVGSFDFGGPSMSYRAQKSRGCHIPAIFNFGDSNSDTGALVASALGLDTPPPYGRSFFHKNSGRFSDGRLIIDFLCGALDLPFLSPYLQAVGADFRHGANFAVAATTVVTPNTTELPPFSLPIQVNQLKRFKARVSDILSSQDEVHGEFLPPADSYGKALYTLDMGQNDLDNAFGANLSEEQVNAYIPEIIQQFASDFKSLYELGGRNFWVHNTGPLGCLPRILQNIRTDLSERDEHGCGVAYNKAAQTFNFQLHNVLKQLRKQLSNATIVYADIYSIKYDLIANANKYGFEHPLTACCGYGGLPYNFNNYVRCAQTGTVNGTLVKAEACREGSRYVNWDGTHYTEAANQHISRQLLSGKFSEPPLAPYQVCHASAPPSDD